MEKLIRKQEMESFLRHATKILRRCERNMKVVNQKDEKTS